MCGRAPSYRCSGAVRHPGSAIVPSVSVILVTGGEVRRVEQFDVDDAGAALARYEELTSAST